MVYRRRNFRRRPVVKRRPAMRRRFMKRRYVRKARIPRQPRYAGTAFPRQRLVKMRYCDRVTITSTAPAIGRYSFNATSIWHPDYTNAGGLAKGSTEWSAFYHRYLVVGSKIRVYCADSNIATAAYPFCTFVQLKSADQATPTDYRDQIETNVGWFSIHNRNFSQKDKTMCTYSLKKFWNVANAKDCFESHGAHFGASPVNQALYHVCIQDLARAENLTNSFLVVIDYSVLLSEPVNLV